MTLDYLLRLIPLLLLVCGLAAASLWLMRRFQPGLALRRGDRRVQVVDAVPLGAMQRLAVVEFGGKHLLLAVSRGRVDLIAETPAPQEFRLPDA